MENDYLIKTKEDFNHVLENTIKETQDLILNFPSIEIYNVILNQLLYIRRVIVVEQREPTFKEKESIMVGPIADKNFKDDDPIYAKKLIELDYCFCNYDTFESDID